MESCATVSQNRAAKDDLGYTNRAVSIKPLPHLHNAACLAAICLTLHQHRYASAMPTRAISAINTITQRIDLTPDHANPKTKTQFDRHGIRRSTSRQSPIH